MDKSKSNYSLRDVFQTKKLLKESSTFHSEVCVERIDNIDYDKSNDNLDYDSVIKQFDELISELSCAGKTEDETINLSKNLTFENEDFVLNRQNLKIESAYCGETCDKDFSINKKSFHCNQSSKGTIASTGDKVLSIDLYSKIYASKPKYSYLNDITPSKKKYENSFPDVKKSNPWVNSHLWNLDKKKDPLLFSEPELEKTNKKISAGDLKIKIKENYCNSHQFMTTIPSQIASTFNASYLLKQHQENLSNSKSGVKYNSGTFSYGGSPLQGKHLCHPKLAFASGKFFILQFVYGMYLVCHKNDLCLLNIIPFLIQ